MYSAAVRQPVLFQRGAISRPTANPAAAIVSCMVTAIDPHTTNVPAEKKPMNSDSPLIHQGTLPPPAKKLFMFLPVEENSEPTNMMPAAKTAMVM